MVAVMMAVVELSMEVVWLMNNWKSWLLLVIVWPFVVAEFTTEVLSGGGDGGGGAVVNGGGRVDDEDVGVAGWMNNRKSWSLLVT